MQQAVRPRPFLLAILDGLALNPNTAGNAFYHAKTPTLDRLLETCPSTTLVTHGERVGLPEGQMGNSEVGHLNIGGGRVVQQVLTRINHVIDNGTLTDIGSLQSLLRPLAGSTSQALHLIGLCSIGGVHSQRPHLEALVVEALQRGVRTIFIHAITDGRDRPPASSLDEVAEFDTWLHTTIKPKYSDATVQIASVIGRYYAMDRDTHWERTSLAYDLFVGGVGEQFATVEDALLTVNAREITAEFFTACCIRPTYSTPKLERESTILSGDTVLFFNYRADRMRQIVTAIFAGPDFTGFSRKAVLEDLKIGTLTEYDAEYPVQVLFQPMTVKNHLGEVLSQNGLTQLRIAETEKYAHVTYFFNGGVEETLPGEERMLVPSPRDVATYDLKPEMSAEEVTTQLLAAIAGDTFDVIILNFANCDMVGHTGDFNAAVKAVETVDTCLATILDAVCSRGGAAIVTADHGNADQMVDYETGQPHTFHTMYPVPCIFVGAALQNLSLREAGALCDISPTICQLLGLPKPPEMTGRSLCSE